MKRWARVWDTFSDKNLVEYAAKKAIEHDDALKAIWDGRA